MDSEREKARNPAKMNRRDRPAGAGESESTSVLTVMLWRVSRGYSPLLQPMREYVLDDYSKKVYIFICASASNAVFRNTATSIAGYCSFAFTISPD